jgi:hypothetical protein
MVRFMHLRQSKAINPNEDGDEAMRFRSIALCSCVLALLGCGLEGANLGKHNQSSSTMAISNAEGEGGVLRTGTALNIATGENLSLNPDTVYTVVVTNIDTGKMLSRTELLSDLTGKIELSTVAHDLGEFDDVQELHTLNVKIEGPNSGVLVEEDVPVTPHQPDFIGHGFQVDDLQPPHVYSADATGTPQNAFVVGGTPDPGEVGPPVYVAGKGFPANVTTVDLYIVKDGDVWRDKLIPQPGDTSYVAGPVAGTVVGGVLQTTAMSWQPEGTDVGIYDVLVDVDRNGTFDYAFGRKDASDGEGKVGFTVQYGAAWLRTKLAMTSKHLLVNLAYTSSSRSGGTWANSYAAGATVYSYINPPVQKGAKHGYVAKLLVTHQDWSGFWNNPDRMVQGGSGLGRIPVADLVVQGTGGTPQQGCTNSPPVKLVNGLSGQLDGQRFDVVFDYGNDGYYDIGVDFLDVISTRSDGTLVTAKELESLSDDQIFGLEIQ